VIRKFGITAGIAATLLGIATMTRVAAAGPRIAAVLAGIHRRAPHARVLLVGYPDILPASGTGCFPDVPLAHGDVPYLRATEVALNRTLARAAAASHSTFVDTYRATIGHDVCQPQAMARQVLAALGRAVP
jgi:hypothetical protein